MRIGIMGGTFNPIHMGHLMMSEYLCDEFSLDSVLFIPTDNPPHKNKGVLDAQIRLEMVRFATDKNDRFQVSDIEVNRKNTTYSIDTVNLLKEEYPNDKLFFIIGSDSLFQLNTWKKFDELAKAIEFIVATRPGYFEDEDDNSVEDEIQELNSKYGSIIHCVETPMYEISSTDIRDRIKVGKSVKYLLLDEVIEYIDHNNLYKE